MNAPRLIGVADLARFDEVIDVRSPAEFADDHLPGALNLPVLDNDERAIVGTLYVQDAFAARRVGAGFVAAHLAAHLAGALAGKPPNWRPVVNCWRGGMRSGSMVQVMRMVGWDAQPLAGGYKTWRKHVISLIDATFPALSLRILCGPTGSAKTRVLDALARTGAQVLDLEGIACHKGSVLGAVPGQPQPSQKLFETRLAHALGAIDPARPVYVEAESRRIGRVALPNALVDRMRASPCVEIEASRPVRVPYLLEDYAYLAADPAALLRLVDQWHGLHPNATLERWRGFVRAGEMASLVEELLALHYDPQYAKSQHGHFLQLARARRFQAQRLDGDGIADLAARIRAAEAG